MTKNRDTFSIADLAAEFAVTPRAIRFYEDKGLITPARDGMRRIYSPRDRVRLMLILRGKRLGFSLKEIQEIIDLYDAEPTGEAQLRRLITTCQTSRAALRQQMDDIRVTIDEIEAVETQCRQALLEGPRSRKAVG
ncbi:MerR family transcriptional regulator [Rhodospirillum rubrum]|uniref:MerR family transcriptional regulator n=1 Tax=Rhodospirillum rubrum TaxID=1085 RepID=UPI001906DD47|nr:MerR family DNA-binding transcriptional regulator [Rhodospirillum rubrum]MBK1665635.1 MerR family transcriptional regulator [Rhodospirillum rubrum]MBK1677727.1 MerR family transcriptional regulator [Rhodospirillum rubrum]